MRPLSWARFKRAGGAAAIMALLLVCFNNCSSGGFSGIASQSNQSTSTPGPSPSPSPAPSPAPGDGSSSAENCTPQKPTLLQSYGSRRPAWQVAGVDYCVGYASSTQLKDPMTISMSGVSLDKTDHVVHVTGSNVTLDGYDFSLEGGWNVSIEGTSDRIVHAKFLTGANHQPPIVALNSATNLYVGYSYVDGNGDSNVGGLIEFRGHGDVVIEYSYLRQSGGDIMQMHSFGNNDLTMRYNLIENAGMASGAHGDYTEFLGGPFSAHLVYNTTYETTGTTQGFMVEPDVGSDAGSISGGEIGHNTMIDKDGLSYMTALTIADLTGTFTIDNNYFDSSGGFGFAISGVRGGPGDSSQFSIYTNNVNMVDGSIEKD